jgi:hypothetical protein
MSILEIGIFLGFVLILYFLMNPLQRKFEHWLFKIFRTKTKANHNRQTIIDVTDSLKKDKTNNERRL